MLDECGQGCIERKMKEKDGRDAGGRERVAKCR